jgi:hypothetical protein
MVNEMNGRGPFERGGVYDEVGPDLGRLHDAWDVRTGQAVLQLLPTERVEWRPEAPWRVSLLCEPEPTTVTVRVEESPASVPLSELANLLALTSSAVARVEDSARLRAHLTSGRMAPSARPRGTGDARGVWTGLVLGLGVGLLTALLGPWRPPADSVSRVAQSLMDAASFADQSESDWSTVSYPMPREPFLNQAVAPCKGSKAFVEINKGCWVVLEQKPPCDESYSAEHEGKCYMPVVKPRKLPQSVGP